ncbi:MAG: ATP-binding protein, partial [Humidesulfovibrio sp.]|nr:ATP-binding protein [Humidesulfovibrio sp.]
ILRRVDRISAERQAEKEKLLRELHQQEKLAGMGRMVAGVAHEIRNPLGIIQSSAELVFKKAKADNHPHTRIIEAIYDESRRLSRTVNDFLDYARPRQPRMDVVDICRILEQAAVFLEHECEAKGITMERDCPPGTQVLGDKDLLYRAVYNVLGNAMQAMTQGGLVQVLARPADPTQAGLSGEDGLPVEGGPWLELQVRDSGPGFDEANLDKMKDPFFSTKDTGTGLGLAIVTSIVESHGGFVALKNHPESGAVVSLLLRAAPTAKNNLAEAPAAPPVAPGQ